MVGVDDQTVIEIIRGTTDGRVELIMVEGRDWNTEIEEPYLKLYAKIKNVKRHIESEEFKEKYGNPKKIVIRLESPYDPPEEIKNLCKKENVEIVVFSPERRKRIESGSR